MQPLCTQLARERIFTMASLDRQPHYTGFTAFKTTLKGYRKPGTYKHRRHI